MNKIFLRSICKSEQSFQDHMKVRSTSSWSFFVGVVVTAGLWTGIAKSQGGQEPGVTWGPSSNSLYAGLYCPQKVIRIDAKTGMAQADYLLAIGNASTNTLKFFWPSREPDELLLLDAQSNAVPRTRLGTQVARRAVVSKRVHVTQWKHAGYVPQLLVPSGEVVYGFWIKPEDSVFNLGRYFYVTNSGKYTMVRRAHICLPDTNGFLRCFVLPDVSLPVLVGGDSHGQAR